MIPGRIAHAHNHYFAFLSCPRSHVTLFRASDWRALYSARGHEARAPPSFLSRALKKIGDEAKLISDVYSIITCATLPKIIMVSCVLIIYCIIQCGNQVSAVPISQFFSFGLAYNDAELGDGDDLTGSLLLPDPQFFFFGKSYNLLGVRAKTSGLQY